MPPFDRREFLSRLSASALLMSAHGTVSFGTLASGRPVDPKASGRRGPRILSLRLLTACPLEELRSFYEGRLGLGVDTSAAGRVRVTAGATEITFVATDEPGAAPFYHFAFNIPENKILAAREWQLERSELFLTPENLRDPNFPDDVRHFRNWNAHSIFFWDPAGNVVEYIARHDLDDAAEGPFTSSDILYTSEIAFVSDDVPKAAADLEAALVLPQYQSASEVFHASGDERGLLLLFKHGRAIGDTLRGRPAPAQPFTTRATIRGTRAGKYAFGDGRFEVEVLAR